jgi:hypothetical protein
MVSVAPTASTPTLQVTVALPEQVAPPVADDETKVVVVGMVSVSVALVVATAPRFVTWIVYTNVPEIKTGVGAAEIETARSAPPAVSTNTEEVVALFEGTGSEVEDVASAVFRIVVPAATPEFTFTTYVKFATEPLVNEAVSVHVTDPVFPAPGEATVQPAGHVIELKVVFGGVC